MLKRAFAICLVCAMFFCLAAPAFADILWEPNDEYYWEYPGRKTSVGRMFYTNGDEGCVVVYTKPAGEEAVAVLPNGCEMYVSFTCVGRDSADWGVIQFAYDENGTPLPDYGWENDALTGWVSMKSMLLIYDHQSFGEEHRGEYEKYSGDAREFIGKEIYLWEYPGSERHSEAMTVSDFDGGMELSFRQTWVDEEGRLWGDINYYYGIRDRWVCLSDPENDALPTVRRGEPVELTPTDTAKVERGVRGLQYGNNNNVCISLAVSLVVICAGGVAYILLKKKTEKRGD